MYNKKSKRAAVSSDTDGKQLVTGKKKRRLVTEVKKEEGEEDESTIKKEEEIENDLHQDKDEDSRKPSAVVKEEEDVKKDGEDVLLRDNDEWEDCKKPPASIKKELKDEVGHEYSPGEIDEKSNWEQIATREENDDEGIYLPDEITSTKGLLPPIRPSDNETSVETAYTPAMTVTKLKSAKHVAHATTPVPIVQVSSALAPNPADEKPAAPGRGNVCNENKTLSEGTEQRGSCREEGKSTKISGYATRSRSNATIVKRKYSLRSLSHENNNKGARSKSLRKEKGSSTSLGEATNRSPMASTDEDAFGRGIRSATSDSADGIIDQDDDIFDHNVVKWNIMYERLRAYKKSHGDCELFWAVPPFYIQLEYTH
jgi:hypothetical protein